MSSAIETGVEIRPFHVEVKQGAIDGLRRRISATRLPERETVGDATQGVQLATVILEAVEAVS